MRRTAELARRLGIEPWRSGADEGPYREEGFTGVNWPSLAAEAGEPGWEPPQHVFCWVALSAEERAEALRKGEREAAAWAAEDGPGGVP